MNELETGNTIFYFVEKAEYYADDIMENGAVFIRPSNEIDPRSIKTATFKIYNEALDHANKYYENIKNPEDFKWLAYLRIFKCIKEPVRIFKDCKNEVIHQ